MDSFVLVWLPIFSGQGLQFELSFQPALAPFLASSTQIISSILLAHVLVEQFVPAFFLDSRRDRDQ